MKNLILLLIFTSIFFCNNTIAQNSHRIKSVNLHAILDSIHAEIIEKGYDTRPAYFLRDSLGQKMVSQFQSDMQVAMKRMQGGCMSKKTVIELENKLLKVQNQIIAFEKETLEILDQSQLQRNQNILIFTKNKIQEFGKKNGVTIMSTDGILFQNDKKDEITSSILQHIHQSEGYNNWIDSFDETERLIQQIKQLDFEIQPIFK